MKRGHARDHQVCGGRVQGVLQVAAELGGDPAGIRDQEGGIQGLQGIPHGRLLLNKECESDLRDLAGNAMTTTVVGAVIVAALMHRKRALKRNDQAPNDGPKGGAEHTAARAGRADERRRRPRHPRVRAAGAARFAVAAAGAAPPLAFVPRRMPVYCHFSFPRRDPSAPQTQTQMQTQTQTQKQTQIQMQTQMQMQTQTQTQTQTYRQTTPDQTDLVVLPL